MRGRSILAAAVLAILLSLGQASVAAASTEWCEEDPIFHFSSGESLRVVVAFPRASLTPTTVVHFALTLAPGETVRTTFLRGPAAEQVTVSTSASQRPGTGSMVISITGASAASFPMIVTTTGDGTGRHVYRGTSTGLRVAFTTGD